MTPWTLVSPASRGIGFALARHLLKTTNAPVVATARKDISKTRQELLQGLENINESRLTVLQLDVTDESSIHTASQTCHTLFPPPSFLHLAFLIPGILYPEKSPSQISAKNALLTFQTNTLGPMLLLKHFHTHTRTHKPPPTTQAAPPSPADAFKNLPKTSTFALMSARVGSISDNQLGGWYSYRASKAGVNQVVKTFDNYLKSGRGRDGVMAIALHPGTVKTEFSQEFWKGVPEGKLFEREWVAERLVRVVRDVGIEGRGRCWDWEGKEVEP